MQLRQPFVRLPLRFDVASLQAELARFSPAEWRAHPERPRANSSISLVGGRGELDNDSVLDPMAPTAALARTPYVERIFTALNAPIGRTRYMRILGNGDAEPHVDSNYYWHRRLRVHIPVLTTPDVRFICGDQSVHMAEGECWVFDTWRRHNVINPVDTDRVHLVIDTPGSPSLWAVIDQAIDRPDFARTTLVLPGPITADSYAIEPPAFAPVMHPDEQLETALWLIHEARSSGLAGAAIDEIERAIGEFCANWRALSDHHGATTSVEFYAVRKQLINRIAPFDRTLALANGLDLNDAVRQLLVRPALPPLESPDGAPAAAPRRPAAPASPTPAFASVATDSFAHLLRQARRSVVVSTYQTNRVITVRAARDNVNTHLLALPRPMGIAARSDGFLSIGTRQAVASYRSQPNVAAQLAPVDTAYMPAGSHVTGDISVHEMAYAGDELWLVNTRFSALCTLDANHSFVPRWRPPFVTAYAAEDRCHLNGLAIVDGAPRYVTALAVTDSAQGWRAHKDYGGCVIDVATNRIVVEGLSMPHSPRWHNGALWVLESGRGSLARVDVEHGSYQRVAELPGFTRGLAFLGPFALVGLSQVRESVFEGLTITAAGAERECGVWIVDTRNGNTVGFLRFTDTVHEIFDVQVIAGAYAELLADEHEAVAQAFVVPDATLSQFA